jgi:hypothetical protein
MKMRFGLLEENGYEVLFRTLHLGQSLLRSGCRATRTLRLLPRARWKSITSAKVVTKKRPRS